MAQRLHEREVREYPFLLVLVIELLGVASVASAPQHWLRAVGVMAAGFAVAGVLRLVLTDTQAGLLRVRRRMFDVAAYWTFGALAVVFALALPQ
jgi:hypothetical protein